jgi:hypothetical protein
MVKIAELEITQRDLYMPESRTPIKGGVLDLRLVRYRRLMQLRVKKRELIKKCF